MHGFRSEFESPSPYQSQARSLMALHPFDPEAAFVPGTVAVKVDCPDCGNANREARRRCKRRGGMCEGTGRVVKFVPSRPPEQQESPGAEAAAGRET